MLEDIHKVLLVAFQEPNTSTSVKDHRLSREVGVQGVFGVEQDGMYSTSDHEELFIDSEDDLPHFSDIEAMVRFL